MTKRQIDKEREAFMAWAKTRFMSTAFRYMEEDTKEFDSPFTAHAWTGWMARSDGKRACSCGATAGQYHATGCGYEGVFNG